MTTDLDLFGEQVVLVHQPTKTGRERKTGYAASPGTGPAGMTCKQCHHYTVCRTGSGKTFRKCAAVKDQWTNGSGTDIKASAAACARFEPAGEVQG